MFFTHCHECSKWSCYLLGSILCGSHSCTRRSACCLKPHHPPTCQDWSVGVVGSSEPDENRVYFISYCTCLTWWILYYWLMDLLWAVCTFVALTCQFGWYIQTVNFTKGQKTSRIKGFQDLLQILSDLGPCLLDSRHMDAAHNPLNNHLICSINNTNCNLLHPLIARKTIIIKTVRM